MANRRILWIDNQLDYVGAHIKVLENAGYDVQKAWSAEEALSILRSSKTPDKMPDLIMLDILMGERPIEGHPIQQGRTGLVLYDILRNELHFAGPIIVVTVIVDNVVENEI